MEERYTEPNMEQIHHMLYEVFEELLEYSTECKIKYLAKCYDLEDKCEELAQLKREPYESKYLDMDKELEEFYQYKNRMKEIVTRLLNY